MKKHLIDRLNEGLFEPDNADLTDKERAILERIRTAFTIWYEHLSKSVTY